MVGRQQPRFHRVAGAEIILLGIIHEDDGDNFLLKSCFCKFGRESALRCPDAAARRLHLQTIAIYVQTIAIYIRTIGADSQTIAIDRRAIGIDWSTIDTYSRTIGIYIQTIASDVQAMTTYIQTI